MNKLKLGRFDYAAFCTFSCYALCSLSIPICLVTIGRDLNFPLEDGGMTAGGLLHFIRSAAIFIVLLACGLIDVWLGKRRSLGLSTLLMGGGVLLAAFSPNYYFLWPCLIMAGIGEGVCEGLATPFVECLHPEASERYVSIAHSFWSVGTMACVLIAGWLLQRLVSWRLILVVFGAVTILQALFFFLPRKPGHEYPETDGGQGRQGMWKDTLDIAVQPRFWVYCLGMFVGAGAEFCLTFWSAAFLQLNFQATALQAGFGTAAIGLGMFTGRTLFGYFAREKYLKHTLLFTALAAAPVTSLLVFLTPETFPSKTLLFAALMVLLFLGGIGVAPFWPMLQVYGAKQLPKQNTTLLYIYFSAIGIPGCGFFTWFVGILGDHCSLRTGFFLIPASILLYALILLLEGWVFRKPVSADRE